MGVTGKSRETPSAWLSWGTAFPSSAVSDRRIRPVAPQPARASCSGGLWPSNPASGSTTRTRKL